MKKANLFLMLVAIIGILSAFTSVKRANIIVRAVEKDPVTLRYYVHDASASAGWQSQIVVPADEGTTYECNTATNKVCRLTVSDALTPTFDAGKGLYYFTSGQISAPVENKRFDPIP